MIDTGIDIEFAHIYAGHPFGEEQQKSIEALISLLSHSNFVNRPVTTSILIDDISDEAFLLNIEEYVAWVESFGVKVDFYAYESKFVPVAENMIGRIAPEHLKTEYFRKTNHKTVLLKFEEQKIGLKEYHGDQIFYSCTSLSSAWTLCRLGVYPFPEDSLVSLSGKTWQAGSCISILPEKYKTTEDKAFTLIKAAGFESSLKSFENKFYS